MKGQKGNDYYSSMKKCKRLEGEMLPKLESPNIIVMDKQRTTKWKSTCKPVLM
jgi:hypothetical protein